MARDRTATKRLSVTLAVATHEYLAVLASQGTHGTSLPDVAKTLIEEGVRNAIEKGFLGTLRESRPDDGT